MSREKGSSKSVQPLRAVHRVETARRARRPSLLAAVAGAAAVAALGGSAQARSAAPPTTVATVRGPVFALAQDGDRLAWRACTEVVVRSRTGAQARKRIAPFAGGSPPCHARAGRGLALAGRLVAWTEATLGMHEYLRVISADLPGEGRRAVISLSNDESGEGDVWSDLAAAGAAVIHGRAVVRREQGCLEEHDFDLTACPLAVRGGGVWRLDGVRPRKIPLMPPTSTVALAGDRVALVPEADGRSVEVRRLGSGTRVARADLDGNVSALAVSRAALVALVVDGRSRALAVLDPATARLRGTYPVAGSVRPILALAGDDLVYQVGRRLWRLDTNTGRRTVVVQLLREPVAFSLEGRRLAWVERRSGVWLVRTLDLNA